MAILLAGCKSLPGGGSPPLESSDVTVKVDNRNFNGATIYAVEGGLRLRIGRVSGKSIETFTFRWEHPQIQMLVDFTAGRPALSGRHFLVPGSTDDLLLVIGSANNATVTLTVNTR